MTHGNPETISPGLDWQTRLAHTIATMRELSLKNTPEEMVQTYSEKMSEIVHIDRRISLSRRGLESPMVRVTRFSGWEEKIDPWKNPDRLPVLYGGLFATLIFGNEPKIINRLELADDDPARKFLGDCKSILVLPLYDQGESLNMVVLARNEADAFDHESLPQWVWMSNLFGRATQTLVLKDELQKAYSEIDRELQNVGRIQRSLLPDKLPDISTMQLAAYYRTSARAGGDYYDFFKLPDDHWGILVADVSGHGTPAAVIMSITHGLAHAFPGPPSPPSKLLSYLNNHLHEKYTGHIGGFVTAFYGIYHEPSRTMHYASAGHNPPRLKRCTDGTIASLDGAQSLPLGIMGETQYIEAEIQFAKGDQVIFYTDGITEAMNPHHEQFGIERLDKALENCTLTADGLIQTVVAGVEDFTAGHAPDDDRTMLVAKIR